VANLPAVVEDRLDHAVVVTLVGPVTVRPFANVPSEVVVPPATRHDVDLFPQVLPHVADVQIPGATIEAEAPRIAQSVVPDLGRCSGQVPLGNAVFAGVRPLHVDAQDRAEQGARVLPIAIGIAPRPAVPQPDVDITAAS